MNPFGPDHSDILFYFFNASIVMAWFFFFLWLKDRIKVLKDGNDSILLMCASRGRECPAHYRTKLDAEKDWKRLNGTLVEIKQEISGLRRELRDREVDLTNAINHHGHTPDGKVVR